MVVVTALYVPTAAHDIVFGDTPELTGVAATLGVAHPPGYPVWTILAHLFTLLPMDTIPFRVSLFSILASAASAAVVYLTAQRLTRDTAASLTAAFLLALVPAVWIWSIVPEVFALADLLAATLLLLLLAWHQTDRPRYFVAAAFVGGLGMSHHQTIALLAPAVLYLMWCHRRRFIGSPLFLRAAIAVVVGLLPYAYLPVAAAGHPPWNWSEISSPADLWNHLLRVDYGSAALVGSAFQGGAIADRLVALVRSYTIPEGVLVAIGLVALYRRDRTWSWTVTIAALMAGPGFIAYSNTNLSIPVLHAVLERFFLLSHVVLAPLAALGLQTIAQLARGATSRLSIEFASGAAAVATAGALLFAQLGTIDQSQNHRARIFANDILSSVRQDAILLESGDPVVGPIDYLHVIEGNRTDITYLDIPLIKGQWYIRQLRRLHPKLVLSYDRYDGIAGTLRSLVDANGVARFDIMGSLSDGSLSSAYGLYRRGLIQELRPRQSGPDPDALAAENDAALRSYHIPTLATVAGRPWDRLVLADYALIASDMGDIFNRLKRYADARAWYERALSINPDSVEAHTGLASIPQ